MKNGLYQSVTGYKCWYKNNEYHRINSPAIIYNSYYHRVWFVNNQGHRLDGPCQINYNNVYWYVNGKNITEKLISYCTGNNIDINNYQNLNKSDKLKLKIKFGLQL